MNYALSAIAIIGGVVYPLYAAIFAKQIREKLIEMEDEIWQTYRSIIITQWIMVLPVIILLALRENGLQSMGLDFLNNPLWILLLISSSFLGLFIFNKLPISEKRMASFKKRMEKFHFLMPKTAFEHKWTIGVSFTAGICEEILYRALLYEQLLMLIPTVPAILLLNLFFALGHSSTGIKNASFAFLLGISLSAIYYFTGSLWIPMLIHVLFDLFSLSTAYKVNLNYPRGENSTEFATN